MDLSRNEILDVSIGDTLSTCPNLTSLKLVLNPICRTPDYRLIIASLISTLCILDDSAVDSMAFEKVSSAMVSEAASAVSVIREEIEDERRLKLSRLQKGKGEVGLSRKKNTTLLSNDDCHDYMEKERWTETAELQVTSSEEVDEVGGGISDTGSLLTHGSTVVLVGSMASAMRQRKRQSLHLQANDNNDYGGIVNEKDEEARSMISGSDCHSRCSTGRSREKDREEESALAVLDFALEVERRGMKYYFNDSNNSDEIGTTGRLGSGRGSRSGSLLGTMDKIVSRTGSGSGSVSGGIAFIGEGDITHHEAMRGSAILHKHALENANGGLGRDASCQYLSIDVDALQNHLYPCKPGGEMSDSRIGEGESGYDYDSYVCTPNFNFHTPDSNGILGPPQLSSKEISDKLLRVREGKSEREERLKKGGIGNKCSKNERLSIREGGRERGRLKDSEVESREEMNSNRFSPPRHKNGQRRISAQSLIPTSPSFYSHHSSPLANAKSRSNEGGLTGRLMTGRLMSTPSASFKIAIDNYDLEELRLRINLKNGPKGNGNRSSRCRSRGAVFGDLSLSNDGEKGVDENCQKYENNCIALQQQYISFGERNLSSKTSESESADVGNYVTGCTGVEVDINGTHSQDQLYVQQEKVEFHNVNDYNSDEDSDNNNNNQRSLSTGGEREGERNREKGGRKQTETIVPGVTSSHSLVHRDMIMRKILSPFPSSSSSSSSVDSESHSPVQSLSTISSPSCRSNSLLSVGVDMIEIVSGAGSMKNRGRMVMDRGGGRRRSKGGDNDNNDDINDDEDDEDDDGDEIRHGHGHGRGHGKSLNHSNVYADTVNVEKDRSRTTSAARVSQILSPHVFLYLCFFCTLLYFITFLSFSLLSFSYSYFAPSFFLLYWTPIPHFFPPVYPSIFI